MFRIFLPLYLLLSSQLVVAQSWEFTLHKHQSGKAGPTLLVIGGIQGDEPGGFNAASLLTTDYRVNNGEVWVVPNLNFESIIKRSRGVHGDMNRKFKEITQNDPEYKLVQKIKRIILDEQVDIILNLHDGSGFYRHKYIDRLHSPNRWGQSLIIDQEELEDSRHGNLAEIAGKVTRQTNQRVANTEHVFHVKNTETRFGNTEMEKTLTYFAIQNGKAAFGVEASKTFMTHYRAYYHLLMIEGFMKYLGIEYEREFNLSINDVKRRIDDNVKLSLYQKKMFFDLKNVRKRLRFVPMKKDEPIDYNASNPLIAVLDKKSYLNIRYGNRSVTKLVPEYFEFDNSLDSINLTIDGEEVQVSLGEVVSVGQWFKINELRDYRVNVIGYTKPGLKSEDGIIIRKKDIKRRYSVDRLGELYRVEVYNKKQFCGMLLIDFSQSPVAAADNIHYKRLF